MSIAQNFPEIKPSLNLDFANVKKLDPRVTFARASEGRYYDGVTTAKAEENLFQYSQEFDNAYWTKANVTVVANNEVAPDGTNTADTLTDNATSGVHRVERGGLTVSTPWVLSVFAKAGTGNWLHLRNATAGAGVWFDLSTGAVGTQNAGYTGSIVDAGGGWYRCIVSSSVSGMATVGLSMANADGVAVYAGAGSTIYLWGAQLEQRSSVTAYTPTTSQPITNYIPVLQTASANVARFDHDPVTGESLGLLVEEQRTNLLTYSEDFSNAAWGKSFAGTGVAPVVTVNQGIAPDGTLSADQIVFNAGAGTTTTDQSILTKSLTVSAIDYSASFWLKTLSGTATLLFRGVAASSYAVITVTDQWQRFSRTELGLAGTGNRFELGIRQGISGIGVINSAATILLWGAQLEAGAFPTSYIPTVASQVTRSSDAASMTGTNFSEWFSNAEGTWLVEYKHTAVGGNGRRVISLNNDRILYGINPTADGAYINTGQVSTPIIDPRPTVFTKVAIALARNDFAATYTGGSVVTDTSVDVTYNTSVGFGGSPLGGSEMDGHIKKISYYPLRLSNTQLQALTS